MYDQDVSVEFESYRPLGLDPTLTRDRPVSRSIDGGTESALERVPTDVFVVLALVVAVRGVVASPVDGVVRSALVGVFVLLVPGYAFTTAVFPGEESWGLDGIERLALSFALSLAGVPMLLIAVAPTQGLTADLVVNVVTVVVVVFTCIGGVRRFALPPTERFELNARSLPLHPGETLYERATVDALLSVVLVASVVLSLAGFGYAVVAPQDQTDSTNVSLLTRNDLSTNYTQDQYPSHPTVGEPFTLRLAVQNNERRTVEYAVLVTLDRVTSDGTVIQQKRINRFQPEVQAGGEWNRTHAVTPPSANKYRLTYLVYLDEVPDNPNRRSAYRSVYLWLDVNETDSSEG